MSVAAQYIDPKVLHSLDPEIRSKIERYTSLGVKQVEAKLAVQRLERAKVDLASAERLHGDLVGIPTIRSDLLK